MTSRRGFILDGAAAWAALLTGRAFAAVPGSMDGPGRRLRVGVLSDIHISTFGKAKGNEKKGNSAETFISALKWFDEKKIDAVIISGDLTNHAFEEEFMAVGDAWRTVFPGGRAKDGRKVAKLFICGNHDWEGWKYSKYGLKRHPEMEELKKHIFTYNQQAFWSKAFDEPYVKYPHIEVKGYQFLGAHWPYHSKDGVGQAIAECAKRAGGKPFFYLQHPHVQGSVFGAHDVSSDSCAASAAALKKCPGAIAITGHSHYSLTDERSIWQGEYTALNAGCLRYISSPSGRENSGPKRNSGFKAMDYIKAYDCRQGMLMDVYDDRIVFARREFITGGSLGADWVVPLGGGKPFDYATRRAASSAPAFPAGAKVSVSEPAPGKTRNGANVEQVSITFPQALKAAPGRDRVFDYRVELKTAYGSQGWETNMVRRFMADGFCKPEDVAPAEMKCVVNATEIPREARLLFEVRAANSFGVLSEPISSDTVKFKGVVVKW